MTEHEYRQIIDLSRDTIFDVFIKQYSYEFGERKMNETLEKVRDSPQTIAFMNRNRDLERVPEPLELMKFVNGLSTFLFASTETACLAGVSLAFIRFLEVEENDILENEPVARYLIDIILMCQRVKLKKSDTFYTRLYRALLEKSRTESGIS